MAPNDWKLLPLPIKEHSSVEDLNRDSAVCINAFLHLISRLTGSAEGSCAGR
jgi:hypothetical protein